LRHYRLKRHPIPVRAIFRHTLVLTYAVPSEVLDPLLPPGLTVDSYGEVGFVAIAMVQTHSLRPAFLPAAFGRDFFLSGYRVFARYKRPGGPALRGLRILRSDTDSALMTKAGNLLTHYNYQKAAVSVREDAGRLSIEVLTAGGVADLRVVADLTSIPAPLPEGSPFASLRHARRFAGPLPFTFDYEPETHSIVVIGGVRENWQPQPIRVQVLRNEFFAQPFWRGAQPKLASAFYLAGIPYRWKRGVVHALNREAL
jgi:hypothetical protein